MTTTTTTHSGAFARIAGTGMAMPDRVMTNADLEQLVDTTSEWILTRTGIEERRIVSDGQATSDLAAEAGRRALLAAGMNATDIDTIIVSTMTPDYPFPATACIVQDKLGAVDAAAFDMNAACSGFIYGLKVADGLIRSGSSRGVLLIGAEVMSSTVNWQDRATCVLFGDGAGAAVLVPDTKPGVRHVELGADGSLRELIVMRGGGSKHRTTPDTVAAGMHYLEMQGREVFRSAVKVVESRVNSTLEKHGMSMADIDLLIPHQANIRIIDYAVERLGYPRERIVCNLERYGNTSAATIPVALHESVQSGLIKSGNRLLLMGFGAGFTWGVAILEWP